MLFVFVVVRLFGLRRTSLRNISYLRKYPGRFQPGYGDDKRRNQGIWICAPIVSVYGETRLLTAAILIGSTSPYKASTLA